MIQYEQEAIATLKVWQDKMLRRPSFFGRISKKVQTKINDWIPERVHKAITVTIQQMIKAVLFGAKHTTAAPVTYLSFELREQSVVAKIKFYRSTAAVEGGITGAGGILLGLADFPLLLALKIKFLFDVAAIYGFEVRDYKERVYLLHIFELAFSSEEYRKNIYLEMVDWEHKSRLLPDDINQFDWRNFQQEYRDYIDLAKMAQLLPVIGAPVGVIVNYRMIQKLGVTAMNAYRMRLLKEE